MYTKIHSSEKSGHDFEKEQGGVYGRIRRKEGKGKMINYVIISKIKIYSNVIHNSQQ